MRILKEMFIEDEEDIGQRDRKFRWKNIDNADASMVQPSTDADVPVDNDEDDNEEEWRRLRYEREQLLLKQTGENPDQIKSTSTSDSNTTGETASTTTNIVSSIFRRTSIVKTATISSKISSPFLINSAALMSSHVGRKSFLNRDEKTLEKLAQLTKASGDGEAIKSTATGRGNYLFIATEKKTAEKRKSDVEPTADGSNPSKKIKGDDAKKKDKARPTLGFFELLSK